MDLKAKGGPDRVGRSDVRRDGRRPSERPWLVFRPETPCTQEV